MRAPLATSHRTPVWPSVVAAFATVVFVAVAYEVEPGPIGADATILQDVAAGRTDFGNRVMVAITNFGGSAGTTTLVLLVTVALLLSRHWREAIFVVVGAMHRPPESLKSRFISFLQILQESNVTFVVGLEREPTVPMSS